MTRVVSCQRSLAVALTLALLTTGSAYPAEKWALLIGIDTYDDPGIGRLKYTVNDAQAMHRTLTGTPGGFPPNNVILMTPRAEDTLHRPTRNNIIAMLTSWLSLTAEEDTVLVYFSGHGTEHDGRGYVLPQDARRSSPELTSINVGLIKEQMQRSKARKRVLVLDACHSGTDKDTSVMGRGFSRDLEGSGGLVILASCDVEESSYEMDESKRGAFTHFLIEALEGKADRDGDGEVWVSEVNHYVWEGTRRWAAARGLSQNPKYLAAVQGEITLVSGLEPESVTPVPTSGTLVVTSIPVGATVSVDGSVVGVTPLSTEVDLGLEASREVDVGLSLSGYLSQVARVTVRRSRTARWRDVRLERSEAIPPPAMTPAIPLEAQRLLRELDSQDVTDRRRLAIGIELAKMGDPRPGVGVGNGVPDIEWVHVSPGGSVDIKGTRKTVSPFYLAKYPVTYAQYQAFVNASDGFNDSRWWRGMPSQYTPPTRTMASQRNRLGNAPRDNVSWYQAVAFTRWLHARLRGSGGLPSGSWELRLPAEWEWQWAAQGGSERRDYPWGSWASGRANTGGVVGSTTVVGMYPGGATVHGLLDMSGNVWEWCLNGWDPPHSTAVDTTNKYRVLRGGSFYASRQNAASSFRNYYFYPHGAGLNRGFRVGLFPPL